jgi:hypothetical protein
MSPSDPEYRVLAHPESFPRSPWQITRYGLVCFWTLLMSPFWLSLIDEAVASIQCCDVRRYLQMMWNRPSRWIICGLLAGVLLSLSILWIDRHTIIRPPAASTRVTVIAYRILGALICATLLHAAYLFSTTSP